MAKKANHGDAEKHKAHQPAAQDHQQSCAPPQGPDSNLPQERDCENDQDPPKL